MFIKYIILSIVGSLTNLLPISYSSHIFIYQNLFNTKIFENNTLINSIYISIPLSIILTYHKDIFSYLLIPFKVVIKKNKHKTQTNILKYLIITSILSTIISNFIPNLKLTIKNTPIYLFILAIFILLSTNKKGENKASKITLKDSIIYSLSRFFNIIPTISPLCSNLFISKILKLNKTTAIKYSLLTLIPFFLNKSILIIKQITMEEEYIAYYLLTITITTIINLKTINYLKDIYYNNKLYKLSIYITLLAIFLLYWYR